MTWLDVVLCGPGWAACALVLLDRWHYRRTRRRYEQRWGVPYQGPDARWNSKSPA